MVALTADGVAYDSSNPMHIGAIHHHQNDLAVDMARSTRARIKRLASDRGVALKGE